MKFQKLEGTYKITEEAEKYYSRQHTSYLYTARSTPTGSLVITPVETISRGKAPTFAQQSRLMTHAKPEWLEKVS